MLNTLLVFIVLFTIGCDQKADAGLSQKHSYSYTEITIPAQEATQNLSIKWDLPTGWIQEQSSEMRLATLRLSADPQAFDCSIVSLPGEAGGVEANVKRWVAQMNLEVPDEELAQLIATSKDHVFDFTQLQKDEDSTTDSMLAAMLELNGTTVFIKLKGSITVVTQNKEDFLSLVKSVRLK